MIPRPCPPARPAEEAALPHPSGREIGKRPAEALRPLAERFLHILEKGLGCLAGLVLAALLAVALCSVLGRYAGFARWNGADELASWLYVFLIFAAFPLLADSPLSMRLEGLAGRLRGGWRSGARVFNRAVVLHASLLLVDSGAEVMRNLGGVSTQIGLPEWCRFAAAPAAGILGALLTVLRMFSERRAPLLISASLGLGFLLFALGRQPFLWPLPLPGAAAALIALGGLLLGVPLPHMLLSSLALAIPLGSLLPAAAILQTAVNGVSSFLLLAIPFFILAGGFMVAAGLAEKLVALADSLVGHRRGGLAQTALLTNVFFSGISGSSLADVAFSSKVLVPGLKERGCAPERAAAIVCATSVLPNIIPPSVAFLMLAVATDLSVGALFMGGLAAGLFLALILSFALYLLDKGERAGLPATAGARLRALLEALPMLGLAALILFGIRLGFLTASEAGALAAVYTLLLAMFGPGRSGAKAAGGRPPAPGGGPAENGSRLRNLGRVFIQSGREAASVGLLIGASAPFIFILAVDEAPAALSAFLGSMGGGPFAFLLFANALLLLSGLCLEVGAGIMLLAPLLLPAAVNAGLDPVHFGIILVVNLMLGGLTPPVGMIVFTASGLCGLSSGGVFRATLPLLAFMLAAMALMSVGAGLWALR